MPASRTQPSQVSYPAESLASTELLEDDDEHETLLMAREPVLAALDPEARTVTVPNAARSAPAFQDSTPISTAGSRPAPAPSRRRPKLIAVSLALLLLGFGLVVWSNLRKGPHPATSAPPLSESGAPLLDSPPRLDPPSRAEGPELTPKSSGSAAPSLSAGVNEASSEREVAPPQASSKAPSFSGKNTPNTTPVNSMKAPASSARRPLASPGGEDFSNPYR